VNLGLDGCAAVVGGSSSGMGRAIAEALAAEGCDVVLFARRPDVLEEAVQKIEARGAGSALAIAGDATDPDALDHAVDAARERFGRIDILVNNTGGPPAGGFEQFADDDWQAAYELTVLSAVRLTRRALPSLRESGRGRIVNITSSAVKEPNEGLLLTNALRPAIVGWAKTLSQDEGKNGITVNNIAPGYIDTTRLDYLYSLGDDPKGDRERDAQAIPARRFGRPSEIGAAVVFLCSEQAAYINGITLLVDGGLARGLLS
jgi:3-oxoacyl-[acyl-carrier protein] reductase